MEINKRPFSNLNLYVAITLNVIVQSCSCQENKGVSQNTISQTEIISRDLNLKNNQISQVVRTVFQDSKGIIWFGTENGAFRLYGKSLIHIDGIRSESGKGVTIKDIAEDKNGKVWFGHTDGISSIDGEKATNYYESDGLISDDVWCIAADSNGNIWIGTIDGTCIFNGQEFNNFELPEGKIDSTLGISSTKMVHSIMEDSKGTLWFSSNAGLFSYSNNMLIDVSDKVGIRTNFVNEVFEGKNGELWVSTKKGLYNLRENRINNITESKIEVGKSIGSIAEDKEGNIWFVSNQHYLYSYNRKEIIEYQKSEENKGPVIFQIYRDQDDRLWFVGYGGAYRLENGKFLNITKNGPW